MARPSVKELAARFGATMSRKEGATPDMSPRPTAGEGQRGHGISPAMRSRVALFEEKKAVPRGVGSVEDGASSRGVLACQADVPLIETQIFLLRKTLLRNMDRALAMVVGREVSPSSSRECLNLLQESGQLSRLADSSEMLLGLAILHGKPDSACATVALALDATTAEQAIREEAVNAYVIKLDHTLLQKLTRYAEKKSDAEAARLFTELKEEPDVCVEIELAPSKSSLKQVVACRYQQVAAEVAIPLVQELIAERQERASSLEI